MKVHRSRFDKLSLQFKTTIIKGQCLLALSMWEEEQWEADKKAEKRITTLSVVEVYEQIALLKEQLEIEQDNENYERCGVIRSKIIEYLRLIAKLKS